MSELIYAQASPSSIGGNSMFFSTAIDDKNVDQFYSEKSITKKAVTKLKKAGFEVLYVAKTSISICGTKELYEQYFGKSIKKSTKKERSTDGNELSVSFFEVESDSNPSFLTTAQSPLGDVIEGIAIAEPPIYFANAFAPVKSYWHLRVPGDVSLAINADRVHRTGNTGKGIRLTMIDTGWQSHPFFTSRGYNILPTLLGPGAVNDALDTNGHGTGESANVFSVAPDVSFRMVKMGPDATAAFNIAANTVPKPHIISCSWGWDIQTGPLSPYHQTLAAAISAAVASGIIVVFSAGNGHFGFPGQHPAVISAGGVYKNINGANTASNYSSGFLSTIYPGRRVPDLSGLVGQSPGARYIMLPVPDGCTIDTGGAGGVHPGGDETGPNDGWAAFSGTSAAAPQIAGVCALMKKKRSTLTPSQAKTILMNTATDVTTGSCFNRPGMNHSAGVGADLATGRGLVNAALAVQNT